ncbi:MAG TPA: nucleotidyltransferase family protein [Burkholderiales bacterium]|nr:nucleotidyltransferase family protein [Burkholderiales bacterium]
MADWQRSLVSPDATLKDTIRAIDEGSLQIALVVDASRRLLGTVTDGDVRRGLLRGVALADPASAVMNSRPTVAKPGQGREVILALMKSTQLHHVPLVDEQGCVVGLEVLDELLAPARDNWVVLMAGGLGSRLRPLTEDTPKPLLKLGQKPILENILENFIEHGFRRFYLSVNYKAEMFKAHFGDGSRFGVEVRYLEEKKRMGTAGALTLLPEKPQSTLMVMNADLLTKVSLSHFLEFHRSHKAAATMGVREYELQVPYGVVRMAEHRISDIAEKPVQKFFVNAGIYALEPATLELIPRDEFFDMPALFEKLIRTGRETVAFPIREYWLDIGQLSDLERAMTDIQAAIR